MNENNQVGLGVYLERGPETLQQLRAIRTEMEAINRLSGRTGGTGESSRNTQVNFEREIKARENAELASMRRMAKARTEILNPRSKDEISLLAQAKNTRLREAREIARQAERIEQDSLARIKKSRDAFWRNVGNTESQLRSGAMTPKQIRDQAALFKRFRDDPARDGMTNRFRGEVAADLAGYRRILNEERANLKERRAVLREQRTQASQGRVAGFANQIRSGSITTSAVRNQVDLLQRYRNDPARDNLTNIYRKQTAEMALGHRTVLNEQRKQAKLDAAFNERTAQFRVQQAANLAAANRTSYFTADRIIQQAASQDRAFAQSQALRREQMLQQRSINNRNSYFNRDNAIQSQMKWAMEERGRLSQQYLGAYNRVTGGGFNMPPPPPNRGNISGSQPFANYKTMGSSALNGTRSVLGTDFNLGVAGRITRNILLYEVVSEATYGLVNYVSNAIIAAKTTVEFANALRFATQQADGNLEATQNLADSFLAVGLSRQQGRAAVVEAARFAEGRSEDIEPLTRIGADIASARGLGIDRTDELIEQLRRRESKFYKRLFGVTVETIYEQEAANAIDARGINPVDTPGLFIGIDPNEVKSRREQISSYVSAMDDEAKENSVLNYILAQGNRFQGEAAERATTLAGRLDKLSAAWLNSQEGLGLFITDLRIVSNIIDGLAGKVGILDQLRPPEIGRSGFRGAITDQDIRDYGIARTTGTRANLLSTIDTYGLPALLAGAGALSLGVLGRRDATIASQNDSYFKNLPVALRRYGGNLPAAVAESQMVAQQARPGVARSIGLGAARMTTGFSNTVGSFFGRPDLLGRRGAIPVYGQPELLNRGPIPSAQGLYSPLINPRLQSRMDMIQGVGGALGGAVGGVAGYSVASFLADKITTNSIVATGISIVGAAVGTGVGSFLGDAAGAAIGTRIAAAGGFAGAGKGLLSLLGGGVGAAGALATTLGVAGAGISGYITGSLLAKPVSQTLETPLNYLPAFNALRYVSGGRLAQTTYAQQLRDEADLKAIEAAEPAFRAQTRERRTGYQAGTNRYRLRTGGPLLTGDQVRQQGGRPGDYEEVFISREQARSMSPEQARLQRQNIVQRLGLNVGAAPRGVSVEAYEAQTARQEIASRIEGLNEEIRVSQIVDPENTKAVEKMREAISSLTVEQQKLNNAAQIEADIRDGVYYGLTREGLESYRADAAERERERKDKERQERQEDYREMEESLNILRDRQRNSFQVIGTVSSALTGPDNKYSDLLAQEASLTERMQQEWGWRGEAAVKYFTDVEKRNISRSINKADYQTYANVTNIREQMAREVALREGPGLSRNETNRLGIRGAVLGGLQTYQGSRDQFADIFGARAARNRYGYAARPVDRLRGNIAELQAMTGFGLGIGALTVGPQRAIINGVESTLDNGVGNQFAMFRNMGIDASTLSPAARAEAGTMYADAFLDIIGKYTPQEIRKAGLQDEFIYASNLKQNADRQRVQDAVLKSVLDTQEDERLTTQLRTDEQYRQAQIARGFDPRDVGREADALLLARTDGVDVKDMTYQTFQQRQEALRRTAEREAAEKQEAKAATEVGLNVQAEMLAEIASIRAAILGGDASVVLQVKNDTQARLDKERLQSFKDARESASPSGGDALRRY